MSTPKRIQLSHPILFSAPMIRAILARQKTMTRRVVKPHPVLHDFGVDRFDHGLVKCPYGQPGDRLWVREAWAPHDSDTLHNRDLSEIYYRADDETKYESDPGWKPSIHMPRWASRLTLEIVSVRVERVQEISERDAWTEGFHNPDGTNRERSDRARYWFKTLWDGINAARGFGFSSNPFVWVIEFRRVGGKEAA